MKAILHRLSVLMVLLGFMTACQSSNHSFEAAPPAPPRPEAMRSKMSAQAPVSYDATVPMEEPVMQGGSSGATATQNRILIYTAYLRIEIKKYEESFAQVQALVKEMGGFIADLQVQEGPDNKRSATMSVRVPEKIFQTAIEKLKTLGKVKSEQVNGQDITEEYTDLETRLKNKRALEARLLDILKTRTGKLSDLLEVERELARVREEIEQAEGRKRFLDNRVSLSTITLELYEPASITSSSQWRPLGQSIENMTEIFARSLGALLLFISGVLPWLIIGAVFLWIFIRWIKRRMAKKRAKLEAQENEKKI